MNWIKLIQDVRVTYGMTEPIRKKSEIYFLRDYPGYWILYKTSTMHADVYYGLIVKTKYSNFYEVIDSKLLDLIS